MRLYQFNCTYTGKFSKGNRIKRFANIAKIARHKLRQLEVAKRLDELRIPLETVLRRSKATVLVNTAFASTINGESVSARRVLVLKKWRPSIIIEGAIMKKLQPITPDEILLEEFLKPMAISQYRLAKEIDAPA